MSESSGTARAVAPGAIAVARLAHLAFFLLTSAYCLLTYNAFAYRQFIKPHLVVWLTDFVVWHHAWYWLILAVTAATMVPELRTARRGRGLGVAYLVAACGVGIWLAVAPVLPQVENDWRGVVLALVALMPPVWLAVYDHRVAGLRVTSSRSVEARLCRACALAGLVVWTAETAAAPWLLTTTGEIDLTPPRLAFGAGVSLLAHVMLVSAAAFIGVLALRLARRLDANGRAEYWAVALVFVSTAAVATERVVFGSLAFTGPMAWILALCLASTVAATWSGVAHRLTTDRPAASPIDAWTAVLPGSRTPRWSAPLLVVLVGVIALGMKAVEPIDWDFLFQKMWVLAFWALSFAYAFGALPARVAEVGWRSLAVPPVVGVLLLLATPRLPVLAADARWVPEFVLEGYAAAAPSFHLLRDVLRVEAPEDATFYRYLRDHSTLQHAEVAPVSIDFVSPDRLRPSVAADAASTPATSAIASTTESPRKPHIFLFVIDSLRRDYLSPYNPTVTFTPGFGAFARESVVFERAFTRYGGTGLSVPAIWSGGMLFHKQYVTPFAPMNALMKLLDADGYRRVMSMDSVVAQIFPPDAAAVELDRGVPIVEYNLCRTLDELRTVLPVEARHGAPLFVYSLPQNLHISQVRAKPVPADRSYPGFVAPVAAEVERLDTCFAAFIDDLKRTDVYDDSLVIVTADHGDSLGEARRWGHSYTMFPEVVRIPLIVHLPTRLRDAFATAPAAPALSTDITPSLYALLGRPPADLGSLFGRSLFQVRTPTGAPTGSAAPPALVPAPPASVPTERAALLTSSYGAVYAVLRDGGRSLYVADGVNNRDYAYDLSADVAVRVGVTETSRTRDRAFIRGEIDRLARLYRFHAAP